MTEYKCDLCQKFVDENLIRQIGANNVCVFCEAYGNDNEVDPDSEIL